MLLNKLLQFEIVSGIDREFVELPSPWEPVFGLARNIWNVVMFFCPSIVFIVFDAVRETILVVDEDDKASISMV